MTRDEAIAKASELRGEYPYVRFFHEDDTATVTLDGDFELPELQEIVDVLRGLNGTV